MIVVIIILKTVVFRIIIIMIFNNFGIYNGFCLGDYNKDDNNDDDDDSITTISVESSLLYRLFPNEFFRLSGLAYSFSSLESHASYVGRV
jgi:hypothetical protein